jgi:DNA replication protein DnaC
LSEAKRQGTLEAELKRLSRIPVIVVDEVDYIPFDPRSRDPHVQPGLQPLRARVDNRHLQQAVQQTGRDLRRRRGRHRDNRPAIHHSEILSLKGDSYRLRGKNLDPRIGAKPPEIG